MNKYSKASPRSALLIPFVFIVGCSKPSGQPANVPSSIATPVSQSISNQSIDASSATPRRVVDDIYDQALASYNSIYSTEQIKALPPLERLVREFPNERVSPRHGYLNHPFKVGPAALDKIGRIRLAHGDVKGALEAFEEMDSKFHSDDFDGDQSGEGLYGGAVGAESLSSRLTIYSGSYESMVLSMNTAMTEIYPDGSFSYRKCDKALEVAMKLAREYGPETSVCWEDCLTYGAFAARLISRCQIDIPSKTWAETVDFFIKQPYPNYFKPEREDEN